MAKVRKCSKQDAGSIIEVCSAIINVCNEVNERYLQNIEAQGTYVYKWFTVKVTNSDVRIKVGNTVITASKAEARKYESYTDALYGLGLMYRFRNSYTYNEAGNEAFASVYDWADWAQQQM